MTLDPLHLHHDGSPRYVRPSDSLSPRLGQTVELRLRTALDAPVERILLRLCPDGEQLFIEMTSQDPPAASTSTCRWWIGRLRLDEPLVHYRFLVVTPDGVVWYNAGGLHTGLVVDAQDFRIVADLAAPDWLTDSVFYQIFPDRFADGDPATNVGDGELTILEYSSVARAWGEPPQTRGPAAGLEFYGGDLPGIEQNLSYLQDLGVNALYLNPVFSARTNHRYDVTDYDHVDPHLGGDAALASLRQALSAAGMRYILDIVPNHCGVMHPWFQAALTDPNTETAEFFTFRHHPDDYASWLGVRSLPKLNYRSQKLRQVMYAGPQSIFRKWLRAPYQIDGWRVDVANMLARQGPDQMGVEVGRGLRQAVKEENPHAYLLGENFFDASHQLQGDMFDASMNYSGFTTPLLYWLAGVDIQPAPRGQPIRPAAGWNTAALAESWQAFRAAIPWQTAVQQFNLLGSHDTPRILDRLGGNPALNRLAAAILFTYVGVPCVYYGDEIGLSAADGGSRACMPWDSSVWDADLRRFYQTLIHLRRTSPALQTGGFQVLLAEENTLAYLRDTDGQWILMAGRRGPQAHPGLEIPAGAGGIPNGTVFEEVFSQKRATVQDGYLPVGDLPPGAQVWVSLS
jgi:alpha-glucosidase